MQGDDQYRYLKDLTQVVINGDGKGIQYWEPAWITSGLNDSWGVDSGWDNVTLLDFTGNVLKGTDYMCPLINSKKWIGPTGKKLRLITTKKFLMF